MYWYWWAWFGFVVLLILVPLSYGWGYRRWGPPYPSYRYRRRQGLASPRPSVAEVDDWGRPRTGGTTVSERPADLAVRDRPWGVMADLVWLAALGAIIWAIVAWAY